MGEIDDLNTDVGRVFDAAFFVKGIDFILCGSVIEEKKGCSIKSVLRDRLYNALYPIQLAIDRTRRIE